MNAAASTDGVHVELTVEGLGRETFGNALGWVWDQVDFLFPVITGQWNFVEAIIPAAILAGLVHLFRLIVHLTDGGRAEQIPRALVTGPSNPQLATWRSYHRWEGMLGLRSAQMSHSPALDSMPEQPPPAPVRQRLEILDGCALLAHELFYSLTRFYVYYLALSVAACWIFGLGDLGTFFAVIGIGGGS